MVRRGLVESRELAQRAIDAGRVLVDGAIADKPSRLVAPAEQVRVTGDGPRFVSRGGEKLAGALEHFSVDVRDRLALDAGASTGGFTDCLLQAGARRVVAVDVGYGQLHERIRHDERVAIHERTNLRETTLDLLGGTAFEVAVADLSFISLTMVMEKLVHDLAAPGADCILLVKPQFEADRAAVSRGSGVVREPEVWLDALRRVLTSSSAAGAAMMGVMVSPLKGAEGNVEFFMHLRAHAPGAGLGESRALDALGDVVARAKAAG